MATLYSIEKLSGSTDGKGIKVAATAIGSGTTIHTAIAGTTDIDLITLMAVNNDVDGEVRTLTLGWGGTTDPDDLIVVSVPCKAGMFLITDRLPLQNGLVVKAAIDEANDVIIFGHVQRVDK